MLVRTNIYLEPQTVIALKANAQERGETMAGIIRKILNKAIKEEKKSWAKSLLALAQKPARSGLGDLAKSHDEYLYGKK